jgi:hypothetical protein
MHTSVNPDDFPVFGSLSKELLKQKFVELMNTIIGLAETNLHLPQADFRADADSINIMIDQVERRCVYFKVYHGIEMGELNEICLYCFWILKFCPFRTSDIIHNTNVKLAFLLLFRAVQFTSIKQGRTANLNSKTAARVWHLFKFHDVSKEAIATLGESLLGA